MFRVRVLGVSIGCLITVIAVEGGCDYKAKVTKAGPCARNKDPIAALENFDLKLSDIECGLQIIGCIKMLKDVKEVEVKYKFYKDGLPVMSGTKKGCGFKEGQFEVKCPLKKDEKLCPGDNIIPLPGGKSTAGMAKGTLKASVEVIADGKKYCYEGSGIVSK